MATEDDTIYVAIGEVEESALTLLWALHNLFPRKVCILHVHQPSIMISSVFVFDQRQIRGVEEAEKDMMNRMDEYVLLCSQAGVSAIRLLIQRDDVAKGIVELINRYNIKTLVMGAAADERFSDGMWLVSEKAQYVNEYAPASCKIWFICREQLIYTRIETGQSSNAPSPSGSSYLTGSSDAACPLDSTIYEEREESECELEPYLLLLSGEEGSRNDQVYDQLEQALQEVESLNRKASEESERRVKAEMDAVRAMRQAKAIERLYKEYKRETEATLAKQRVDLETITRQREEDYLVSGQEMSRLESQVSNSYYVMTQLEDKLSLAEEQLKISQKKGDELQVELENTRKVVLLRKQAEGTSSTSRQQFYPVQFFVSEIHNETLTEELLRKQTEGTPTSSSLMPQQPFIEFSESEIQEATQEFDPLYKIAEGTQGSVYYKCVLRHTEVAIKVFGRNSLQDPSQFQQEVEYLSRLRHPNLVTLIGACPEIRALIYEYVPKGSLEDYLKSNDTLSAGTRIHIATELCSALMFLHSSKLVHGNLKPGNILLDDKFGCKLSDFGDRRALSLLENSSNGHHPYIDPDFLNTKRISRSLDLYPFGVILLQLLSGRQTPGIAEIAENALLNEGNLSSFLDSSAGNWPHQVQQLTHLVIKCCDDNPKRRSDLSDVMEVLKRMRSPSGASSSYTAEPYEDDREPPYCFLCPILQEVMSDPRMTADGHTYEASAIQEWLADHDTSPKTNLRLRHCNLVPNFSLRSAIEHWHQNR